MKRLAWAFLLLSLAGCYRHFSGAEDLSSEAREYLKKHSSEDADTKWRKNLMDRINEKMQSNDSLSGQNAAADAIVYDWFADRIGKVREGRLNAEEKIDVCRVYLVYVDNRWKWPAKIDEYLTLENYRKWVLDGVTVAESK